MARTRIVGVLAIVAFAVTACQDAFFFEPATEIVTPVSVSFSFVESGSAEASSAGPGDAFDKADEARVVLFFQGQVAHEETAPLVAEGSDKKFTLNLELEGQVSFEMELDLMSNGQSVFAGTTQLNLTAGQQASVDVPLSPVTTSVQINDVPATLRLGGATQLSAEAFFVTGDGTGTIAATWQALTSNVQVSASGFATALGTGTAQVRATFGGHSADASFNVFDPCENIQSGTIAPGQTVNGALSRADDCLTAAHSLMDVFDFTFPASGVVGFTQASPAFTPKVQLADAAGTFLSGFTGSAGALEREFLAPAGSYQLQVGSTETGTGLSDAPEGSYTLSMESRSLVQEGCRAETAVIVGTSAVGRMAVDDCPSSDPIPTTLDRFVVRGDGSLYTVTLHTDPGLTTEFYRWRGGSPASGFMAMPGGETADLLVQSVDGVDDYFYVFDWDRDGTGGYAFTVAPGDLTGLPNLAAGAWGGEHPDRVDPQGTFTLHLDVLNLGGPQSGAFTVSVFIAAQPDLNGPQAFLGTMNYAGGLPNAGSEFLSQNFTIPNGVNGPHFIVVEVDGAGQVIESNEDNIFGLGAMNVASSQQQAATPVVERRPEPKRPGAR